MLKRRIRIPRIVLIILHRLSALETFWGSRFRPKFFSSRFLSFSVILVHNTHAKTPDLDSSHRADHFAPVISFRGLLGLEIRGKVVLSCFLVMFRQLGLSISEAPNWGQIGSQ